MRWTACSDTRTWATGRIAASTGCGQPDRIGGSAAGYPAMSLAADLDHLGAVAAAVAITGGATAQVVVPVVAGAVQLPGLGRLVVKRADGGPPSTGAEWAFLEMDADWLRLRVEAEVLRLPRASVLSREPCQAEPQRAAGGAIGGLRVGWEPVRVLTAPGIRVACEHADVYRDGGQSPAAPRLGEEEFARWQLDFAVAWQQIQSNHPAYGPALATGLSVLTPISAGAAAGGAGPAARPAFGVVETALTADPATPWRWR